MTEEALTGRTILVTGGAGFIGSHIVDALVPENNVRVLDDFTTGVRDNLSSATTTAEGDLRDESVLERAMADVDLVFHEAALVSVEQSVQRPNESHAVNVRATIGLLDAARREGARVVGASSSAIYGEPEAVPVGESEPKTPASPYGLDKLALDHYLRLYHELYGVETVALRYFNVYGPRQRAGDYSGVISVFRRQAEFGEPITVDGDGSQTRDFVHIDDVVRANLRAATTDHVGESYNIGTGSETSVQELAESIQSITDSDSEIVHTDPRAGDVRRSRADITNARRDLGYEPMVALEDGLRTLVR
jgi:UDP-glucose 4-epimerase